MDLKPIFREFDSHLGHKFHGALGKWNTPSGLQPGDRGSIPLCTTKALFRTLEYGVDSKPTFRRFDSDLSHNGQVLESIQAGLRLQCSKGRAGSNPVLVTKLYDI